GRVVLPFEAPHRYYSFLRHFTFLRWISRDLPTRGKARRAKFGSLYLTPHPVDLGNCRPVGVSRDDDGISHRFESTSPRTRRLRRRYGQPVARRARARRRADSQPQRNPRYTPETTRCCRTPTAEEDSPQARHRQLLPRLRPGGSRTPSESRRAAGGFLARSG